MDESVRFETSFSSFCWVRMCFVRNCWLNARPRHVRFSFEGCLKAVKSALGRVNTHGISNLTQHQSKALLYFMCGKDSFVCLPTGHGKSLIYQLEQKNLGCGCFRTKKFYFWIERESMRRATRMSTLTLIFMVKWHLSWSTARQANGKRNNYLSTGGR